MIIFKKLVLNNYVLFDRASLDLDYKGLSIVGGINKNAGGENKSNGSGKSLLVSSIPTLLFGTDPSITVMKSRAKRDAFYRKGSSIKLYININNKDISIEKYLKGKSIRYDIKKDGESLDFTTAKSAEEWIGEIFPTEEQFYSTVYLDSTRPSFTMLGQGSQRFNFFSNLFDLNVYDSIKKHIITIKEDINKDKFKYTSIISEIEDLEKENKTINIEKDIIWCDEQQRSINENRNKFYKIQYLLKQYKNIKHSNIKYNKGKYKSLKNLLEEFERQKVIYEAYEEWRKIAKNINIKKEEIQKKINEIKIKDVAKDYSKDINILEEKKKRRDILINEYFKLLPKEYNDIKLALNHPLKDPEPELDKQEKQIINIKGKIHSIEENLYIIKQADINTKRCPICGNKISKNHIEKKVENYNADIKELKKIHKKIIIKIKELKKQKSDYNRSKDIEKELRKLGDNEDKKLNKYKKYQINIDKYKELKYQLDKLIIPEAPKAATSINEKEWEKTINELKKQKVAKKWDECIKYLESEGFSSLKELKSEYKKVEHINIEKMQKELDYIRSNINQYNKNKNRINELNKKAEKLRSSINKIKLLDSLIDAYSSSGLKRIACAEIANSVETNLNDVSYLIFNENYKFHFEVTNTDFKILFEDKRGMFDIRNLSGGESRCFNLLCMLGILPLLPNNMRTNILVLDEMDVNLDTPTQDKLVNSLIPALNEIIPHIIIVSPIAENYNEGRRITVCKNKNLSSLVYE